MLPLRCMLCQIPAAKNDALIGRPRVAKVPRTVRHKGSKVVNLSIELRYVVFKLWWKQTLQGNCQKKKMCKARSRKRWRSKTIDQAARALIRIGWNLARHKLNKPSLQVPMKLDESSTRQGSKHAYEVIPTLLYPSINSSNPSFLWNSQKWFGTYFVLFETPDTLLLDSQNKRGWRGGKSWWCQTSTPKKSMYSLTTILDKHQHLWCLSCMVVREYTLFLQALSCLFLEFSCVY